MNDRRLAKCEEALPSPGDSFGERVVRWANLPRSPERYRVLFFRLRREVRNRRALLAAMSPAERAATSVKNAAGYREVDAMHDAELYRGLERALDFWVAEDSTAALDDAEASV